MGVQAERPCVYLRTAAAIILEVNSQGIPRQQQKDFLQEYYLVCIRTIEAYPFPQT